MHASAYRNVYALGKNHMQPLKEISLFDFDFAHSENFCLPLPKNLLSYKELELKNSFIHGIHKLLLFNIIHEEDRSTEQGTLAHIHNCYATLRYNKKLPSNFLLR